MNDQETPQNELDDTREIPGKARPKKTDTQELTPPLQALMKDQPTEDQPPTPQDGETMPDEITLQSLAAKVIMNKVEFDAFKEVVEIKLNALLTPQQITDMIHTAIKQASEEFDNAVARIEKIGNEISSNFAGHQMVVARLDVLQPQVVQMIQAHEARTAENKKLAESVGYMARALSLMMGQDITQPDSLKFGKSIIQIVDETEDKTENAIKIAQHAELDVAEARRDFAAMVNQAQGLRNLLQQTQREVEQRRQEAEQNKVIIAELKADKDARNARAKARQEWVTKAFPKFIQVGWQFASNPAVSRVLIWLLTAILGLLGYQVTLGQ